MNEKLPKNVKIIETPEAQFRIIYSVHVKSQRPEDLGNADVLVLESGSLDYTTREKAEESMMEEMGNFIQYEKIVKKAEEQNKPIFFADVSAAYPGTGLAEIMLISAESLVGIVLFKSLKTDIFQKKAVTRREFFKRSIKGIAGIYLVSPFLSCLADGADALINSSISPVGRFINTATEKVHPEIMVITITLRNYLMAQKLKTIAERIKKLKGEKPEIAIVVGAAHTGIEKALQKQDYERVKLIDRILHIPGLKEVRKNIAVIARLDFDKTQNKWVATEIFKDPYLAAIEKRRL